MSTSQEDTYSLIAFFRKLLNWRLEKKAAITAEPADNRLETTKYSEPPKGVDPAKLEAIIGRLHSLTATEMKQYLKEIQYPVQGNKKQLRKSILNFYRKEYASYIKKTESMSRYINKTSRFYEFLVVIDFECTCQEVIYDYPHEIIEFPAVLVDVNQLEIVDKFRTFVRPTVNPILDPFCIDFCHITQETVNQAPLFPEAYMCFLQWLEKHNLGAENRRYAIVTDGPHDIWKFFQYQCMLSDFKEVPHQFRHWINLKKTFEQKTKRKILKGQGTSAKERVTAIQQMLDHYKLEVQGVAHFGLDDSINIARIAIELMRRDRAELRINEKMSRKMTPQEERNMKKNDQVEKNETNDLSIWRRKLPLKLRSVTREEFLNRAYLDCDSCDEGDDD